MIYCPLCDMSPLYPCLPCLPITLSPCLPVSLSPYLPISLSPCSNLQNIFLVPLISEHVLHPLGPKLRFKPPENKSGVP